MAKARKKTIRKAAKKTAKRAAKTKPIRKTKARKPAKRTKKRQGSFVDAVLEVGQLRSRLAGHNTFED